MAKRQQSGRTERATKLALIAGAVALGLGAPSAGLAVVSMTNAAVGSGTAGYSLFTPATVDPGLARRVAASLADKSMRFTPATTPAQRDRTYTVAVRVDDRTARAITVRSSIAQAESVSSTARNIAAITPTRYNLGVSRGYQSFAKTTALPDSVRKLDMPDLARFKPSEGVAADKPGRFQPRIALEDTDKPGRQAGTFEGLGTQSVDVGGAYRVMRNLDVTAGVRVTQERDRIAPLTDSVQDSQAVYVGTQFRF